MKKNNINLFCNICGAVIIEEEQLQNGKLFSCSTKTEHTRFTLQESILNKTGEERQKLLNAIAVRLIYFPKLKRADFDGDYNFYYYEKINDEEENGDYNIARDMYDYPKTFPDRIEKSLLNLAKKYPITNQTVSQEAGLYNLLFCEFIDNMLEEENLLKEGRRITTSPGKESVKGFLKILQDLEYISKNEEDNYRLSAKAWLHISNLIKKETKKQGFIAMQFSGEGEEETVLLEKINNGFHEAIREEGYAPSRIDYKEHNNQIVPEIFYEIDQSRFLVLDLTIPNLGAYYEAGYAFGKGKEVIVCCKEDKVKPHFDLAQKSTVFWKDEDDLIKKLRKRIEATIV